MFKGWSNKDRAKYIVAYSLYTNYMHAIYAILLAGVVFAVNAVVSLLLDIPIVSFGVAWAAFYVSLKCVWTIAHLRNKNSFIWQSEVTKVT